MRREGETARALMQEIYLQELTLTVYRIYESHLRDAKGRDVLKAYLERERFRGAQIENHLRRQGLEPAPILRSIFRILGRIYGGVTVLLGTRLMLRIVLSASGRAARAACRALGGEQSPDLLYLASLRARNEGDLLDDLRQHLIDSRSTGRRTF